MLVERLREFSSHHHKTRYAISIWLPIVGSVLQANQKRGVYFQYREDFEKMPK